MPPLCRPLGASPSRLTRSLHKGRPEPRPDMRGAFEEPGPFLVAGGQVVPRLHQTPEGVLPRLGGRLR